MYVNYDVVRDIPNFQYVLPEFLVDAKTNFDKAHPIIIYNVFSFSSNLFIKFLGEFQNFSRNLH